MANKRVNGHTIMKNKIRKMWREGHNKKLLRMEYGNPRFNVS